MNMPQPQDTNLLKDAVLVVAGGGIGLVSALIAAAVQRKHDAKQKAGDERRSYKAWRTGLRAELDHIQAVISEITGIIDDGHVSTKRINSDFLKEARMVIFRYDEDTDFLEQLTTAFRDIVHTNGMLDRLETGGEGIRPNVAASMRGVRASVDQLSATLDAKLTSAQNS